MAGRRHRVYDADRRKDFFADKNNRATRARKTLRFRKDFFGGLLIERNREFVPDAGVFLRFSMCSSNPDKSSYEAYARLPSPDTRGSAQ